MKKAGGETVLCKVRKISTGFSGRFQNKIDLHCNFFMQPLNCKISKKLCREMPCRRITVNCVDRLMGLLANVMITVTNCNVLKFKC